MSLAVVSDVITRMGRASSTFTTEQTQQIALLLDDAESMLIGRIPLLMTQASSSSSPVTSDNIIRVEAAAVRRVMLNPSAFSSETIDGWTGIRDQALSAGLLYFLDEEWALLLPTVGTRRRGSILMVAYGEYPLTYTGPR